MNKTEIRERRTNAVGKTVRNGHKGRSQKGCFGSPKPIIKKEKQDER